jgi:hypothetical protein
MEGSCVWALWCGYFYRKDEPETNDICTAIRITIVHCDKELLILAMTSPSWHNNCRCTIFRAQPIIYITDDRRQQKIEEDYIYFDQEIERIVDSGLYGLHSK